MGNNTYDEFCYATKKQEKLKTFRVKCMEMVAAVKGGVALAILAVGDFSPSNMPYASPQNETFNSWNMV